MKIIAFFITLLVLCFNGLFGAAWLFFCIMLAWFGGEIIHFTTKHLNDFNVKKPVDYDEIALKNNLFDDIQ